MPSRSEAQARLMAAAAHTPGGYGGVPQKVGRDFNQADKGGSLLHRAMADRLRSRRRPKVEGEGRAETRAERGVEE